MIMSLLTLLNMSSRRTFMKLTILASLVSTIFIFLFIQNKNGTWEGDGAMFNVLSQRHLEMEISNKQEEILGNEFLPSQSPPMFVLLLSSMPRSGSTLMSEVLGNIKDSVVFFEPLWLHRNDACIQDVGCVENYLMNIFNCNYEPDFEKWLKSKHLFLHYFNPKVRACFEEEKDLLAQCIKNSSLTEMCSQSPVRIMKLIRARIHWFEKILQNSTINFKMIHLIRDPRGSMNSISKFGNWNKNPYDRCSGLDEDMNTYDSFAMQYPSKIFQVSYEDFCLHPSDVTSQILDFLFGSPDIPQEISHYIETHMTQKIGAKSMSTFKDSKTEFEAWRWKISKTLFESLEKEPTCLRSIQKMKHTVFETIEKTKDPTIPLFLT